MIRSWQPANMAKNIWWNWDSNLYKFFQPHTMCLPGQWSAWPRSARSGPVSPAPRQSPIGHLDSATFHHLYLDAEFVWFVMHWIRISAAGKAAPVILGLSIVQLVARDCQLRMGRGDAWLAHGANKCGGVCLIKWPPKTIEFAPIQNRTIQLLSNWLNWWNHM